MTRQRKDGSWASERKPQARASERARTPGRQATGQATPEGAVAGLDQVPRDSRGNLLKGGARDAYIQRQADIAAALAARQAVESVAAVVTVLASRLTGLPGPDAVRALMQQAGTNGLNHALAVTRAAGHSVPAQASQWREDTPRQRQASAMVGGGWQADPDHDPRVMEAIKRGASAWELNQIRQGVAAERQQARTQQQRHSGVMWETRTGTLHDGTGEQAVPVQRSVVTREWESFRDHQPPAQEAPQAVVPPAAEPSIWAER